MKYFTTKSGKYPEKKNQNTEEEYFGKGWSVKRNGDNYVLSYISGSLKGELKSIPISKEDFESAKSRKMDLDQFCNKYNVS